MTNRNDKNNWLVIALHPDDNGGRGTQKGPVMICSDQAENVARAAAEVHAKKFPNIPIGLYERKAIIIAEVTTKWEG